MYILSSIHTPIAHAKLRVNNPQIVCNNIIDQFCNQCNYDLPKNKESTYKRTTDQLNVLITQMDVISTQNLHINRIHVKKNLNSCQEIKKEHLQMICNY